MTGIRSAPQGPRQDVTSRACPACGAAASAEARFCSACATPLTDTGPGRLERKLATALFADVVGSTALVERGSGYARGEHQGFLG